MKWRLLKPGRSILLGLSFFFGEAAFAATISDCNEASLRLALAGGGEVTFASDCVISLSNTITIASNTVLNSGGRSVTISGNSAVRLFQVEPGVTFTLRLISLADGQSTEGAAIYNDRGTVNLVDCALVNHAAVGTNIPFCLGGSAAAGGAIANRLGTVTGDSCLFSNNVSRGGEGGPCIGGGVSFGGSCGGAAQGGGIADDHGQVRLTNCQFFANSTIGGVGGSPTIQFGGCGGPAIGGAIYSLGGSVTVVSTLLSRNLAIGGSAGSGEHGDSRPGGVGSGGAVAVELGQLEVIGSQFELNEARGGGAGRVSAGGVADGGAVHIVSGTASLTECSFAGNKAVAGFGRNDSALSAPGHGGALFNGGTTTVARVLFSTNSALGATASSRGRAGGTGSGGALYNGGTIDLSECALVGNSALGGGGALLEGGSVPPAFSAGGDAHGGAICNAERAHFNNCTISGNQSIGGPGGIVSSPTQIVGPAGSAFGGALYNTNLATLRNVTLAENSGLGGAAYSAGQTTLLNTILANSLSGSNCMGTFTDAGHNISSDDSCLFGNTGSLINTDPQLAPLADNGGPTPTMALFPGSPAIDAGSDLGCPTVDQRGMIRPGLAHCDIGAYEFHTNSFQIATIQPADGGQVRIEGMGLANQSYSLQTSAELANWQSVGRGTVSATGRFEILTPVSAPVRFYRIIAP